jgi:6-phosphogluconate dehydrogenase
MVGGSDESYATLGPMLRAIAAQVDGEPCCAHLGTDGAGHFVKMVHNGIEYSDMQLIAEAYDLLRQGLGATPADLAQVFRAWNQGELESYLIEITAEVLGHVDATTGSPFVDIVADQAEQKGTGRWTVQTALELGVPVTGIAEAVFARSLSALTDERNAARPLPGPDRNTRPARTDHDLVEDVRRALYASKIVAYAQGFDQIAAASAEYGWNIDRAAVATIWRGGCIIRARFLSDLRTAYTNEPVPPTLLADGTFADALAQAQDPWRRVVATAASIGVPTPGFASALAYYDGLRREHLPASLIQGLRDYFGAHTYARVDRAGTFHTDWSAARQERPVG